MTLLAQFGIDEIYFHENLDATLLEKLQRRANLWLDGENNLVQKNVTHDLVLVFYKQVPSQSLILRFLKMLHTSANEDEFIKSNTLLNENDLFGAVKDQTFVLVTSKLLPKELYIPE